MTQDIRVGVIGLGDTGNAHALAIDRTDGARLVAICDSDPTSRDLRPLTALRSEPDFTPNASEVIQRDDLDAVFICVPDHLHLDLAREALAAGKHLFLEKPLANTLEATDAIIEAAQRAGTTVQIGLVYRCSNLYRTMAQVCAEELGGPSMMWCKELRQCFPQRRWYYRQECTGGTLVEKDCHHFDLFNWMIGSPAVRVFATGGQHVWREGEPVEVDCSYCPDEKRVFDDINVVDHAVVAIDYANGAKASLLLCMYLVPENLTPEGLEVGAIGKTGHLAQAVRDSKLTLYGGKGAQQVRDIEYANDAIDGYHIGFRTQHTEFVESIRTGKTPAANLAVAREASLVAFAAEESIRRGEPVSVEELRRQGAGGQSMGGARQ